LHANKALQLGGFAEGAFNWALSAAALFSSAAADVVGCWLSFLLLLKVC